jgi:hypothetical protein
VLLEEDGVFILTQCLSTYYHNHSVAYHSLWALLKLCALRPATVGTLTRIDGIDRLLHRVSLECSGCESRKDLALQLLVMLFVSGVSCCFRSLCSAMVVVTRTCTGAVCSRLIKSILRSC